MYIALLIVGLTIIYLSLLQYVYRHRKHPCVHSRSPTLIIIEGLSLLGDTIMNLVIMTKDVSKPSQCVLGVVTTVSFHYLAVGSLVLRAYRIRKFFDVYNSYFKSQYPHSLLERFSFRFET
jgi:membrane-associated HD superfamily phosphohydrolase